MNDLERKLEEIARKIFRIVQQDPLSYAVEVDAGNGEWEYLDEFTERTDAENFVTWQVSLMVSMASLASQATARYCAEIVKAVPERGWDENHPQASWMRGYVAGFDVAAETILRECGVKE